MAEQPTQKEFKAVDIVDYAMSSQPIRVNDAFDSIIADKVISSLAISKLPLWFIPISAEIYISETPVVKSGLKQSISQYYIVLKYLLLNK